MLTFILGLLFGAIAGIVGYRIIMGLDDQEEFISGGFENPVGDDDFRTTLDVHRKRHLNVPLPLTPNMQWSDPPSPLEQITTLKQRVPT